jgi:hypothetical protein
MSHEEAVIKTVSLGAAHEGHVELLVTLRFPTGGESVICLDPISSTRLMDLAGAQQMEDLIGCGWTLVRDAISAAHQATNSLSPRPEL